MAAVWQVRGLNRNWSDMPRKSSTTAANAPSEPEQPDCTDLLTRIADALESLVDAADKIAEELSYRNRNPVSRNPSEEWKVKP